MRKTIMEFNWSKLWSWIYWIATVGCIIEIILAIPTLQRWKWGYYTLDWIPPFIIIFILLMVNILIRVGSLERYVQGIKDVYGEHK